MVQDTVVGLDVHADSITAAILPSGERTAGGDQALRLTS